MKQADVINSRRRDCGECEKPLSKEHTSFSSHDTTGVFQASMDKSERAYE